MWTRRPRPKLQLLPEASADALASVSERARAGDRAAIRALLVAIGPSLLRVARQVLGPGHPEIQRYPSSIEAGVAEVALGKWSLGQGLSGDAIDWFRAYQRRGPGALTAEALFGEARALESIGSLRDAREPWRRLLELYPDSPYASVARQRLERP